MKLKNKVNFAAILPLLIASVSVYGETFTLNNYTNSSSWDTATIWDITGTTTQTFPQNGGDVIFSNTNQTAAQSVSINGLYKIDSFSFSLKGSSNHYKISASASGGLEIANDSIINSSFNWNQFMLAGSGSYDFKKNLTIKNDIGGTQKSMVAIGESTSTALASFKVGGNLDIQKNTNGAMDVFFKTKNITIGGNLKIASGVGVTFARSTSAFESVYNIGGLEGSGTLNIGWNSYNTTYCGNKSVTNITIKNGSSWSGDFAKYSTNADTRFNVDMNATGTQNFRVAKSTFCTGATNLNVIDTLTVENGFFNYYAADNISGTLLMKGGKFSAAASAAPETGYDIGTINFTTGEWSGGTLLIEIAGKTSFDKIVFSGALTKSETDLGRAIELAFDSATMAQLVSDGGGSATFEDLVTYSSDSNIEGTVVSGVANGFNYVATFGDTGMSLAVTVPEPSTIAAIFGALALGVAFLRKGRKE